MKRLLCLRSVLVLFIVIISHGWGATPAGAQTMVGLGNLAGDFFSHATGVSADGSTAVGYSGDVEGYDEAFVWTAATGMVGLGYLPSDNFSHATSVSADGSTVVGFSMEYYYYFDEYGEFFEVIVHREAFAWTAATGMVGLGYLPGDDFSGAADVSADGSTVVGQSYNDGGSSEAFVWTSATGMIELGNLPGSLSFANAISADGSTVVGTSANEQGDIEAFVWTAATGMQGLGHLPGSLRPYSHAMSVSADGSTVVGVSWNDQDTTEAFVWTAATGMVGLSYLPGDLLYPYSQATGVSADGSTVVGSSSSDQPSGNAEAFVWTTATGMIGLGNLPNSPNSYSHAAGVSADGSTVVGDGINAQGSFEAFILHLEVDPADLIVDLIQQVALLNLQHGIENSLDAKLDAAFDALADVSENNNGAAVNTLNAFINAVLAQRGTKIPAAAADALIAAAQNIIALLQQ